MCGRGLNAHKIISTRWRRPYSGYFGFIFMQWEDASHTAIYCLWFITMSNHLHIDITTPFDIFLSLRLIINSLMYLSRIFYLSASIR